MLLKVVANGFVVIITYYSTITGIPWFNFRQTYYRCEFKTLSGKVYSIQHYVIKFLRSCGRSVVFSVYSGFFHRYKWPSPYNWNIVEGGIKYQPPQKKPNPFYSTICTIYRLWILHHSSRHDITEILLKVAVKTKQSNPSLQYLKDIPF